MWFEMVNSHAYDFKGKWETTSNGQEYVWPWEFGILYMTMNTKAEAEKAVKTLDGTAYVPFKPYITPIRC